MTPISELFEDIAYYTTYASMELAKELGPYAAFEGSEWDKGNLLGGKAIEQITTASKKPQRWIELMHDIQVFGVRNSHITAIAPNTSSSLLQGCSASILPVYSKFYYDKNSKGSSPIAPPFIDDFYWFYKENKVTDQNEVVDAVSVMQKWIDTGISMELLFNLNSGIYSEGAITAKDIFNVIMNAWEKGCKAIYYIRSVQKDDFGKSDCVSCAN